ncbi:MAG: Clp protease N-terminal domain-containing protein [Acidimicrobiia bacterium]
MGLLKIGGEEARRLGHDWMGPEHTLLGILRGDADDPARRALEQVGVDAAIVEGWLARMTTGSDDEQRSGVTPNPRWQTIHGRAEGIAAGLGAGDTTGVHFLLAVLWDRRRWSLTETPGVTREAIVGALEEMGVPLPRAPLPPLDRKLHMTQHVEFPREATSRVIDLLVKRHPPGSGPTFGFNYKDDETAWVNAEDGIDLQAIVDEALAHPPET